MAHLPFLKMLHRYVFTSLDKQKNKKTKKAGHPAFFAVTKENTFCFCKDAILSVKKQKVSKEFFTRLKEKILACAKSSVRRLFLRRPIRELRTSAVRCLAAFELVQPSYALAAFAEG